MTISRVFIIMFAMTIALSACSSDPATEELNIAQEAGSPFNMRLAQQYRIFARELKIKRLAKKGNAIVDGIITMPEPISSIDRDTIKLAKARTSLLYVLNSGGRYKYPYDAADAQAYFDCWALDGEKAGFFNRSKKIPCKLNFSKTLSKLLNKLNDPKEAKVAYSLPKPIGKPYKKVAKKGPLAPLGKTLFMVFFEWNEATLTRNSINVIEAIAQELYMRDAEISQINITGHSDTSGGTEYNDNLSSERAINISYALIQYGIPHKKMYVEGMGERDLMLKTPDNMREPSNRRVEITLE